MRGEPFCGVRFSKATRFAQLRSICARTTCMSLVETFMVAFDISSDQRFIRDSDGDPYFGTVTHFISYLWGVEFKVLIDAIDTTRQRSDGATQVDHTANAGLLRALLHAIQ